MSMSTGKRIVALLALFGVTTALHAATASFADFDTRARAGERLNVVYLGASLTYSANATDPNVTGFRGLMGDYLEKRYPKAHFRFFDAAIGGTTSKLALFRLERDVLSKKPDLVFLDFVCNDGGDNVNADNTCAYEQILRTLIGKGVPVEQLFFTFRWWMEKDGDCEKNVPRQRLYANLGRYYGTPCADAATVIRRKLVAKETTLDEIWPIDGGHPADPGYKLFFEAAKIAFERAVAEKAICQVPSEPLYGSVEDVQRRPLLLFVSQQPAGWRQDRSFRTSMWYDGLSSRWLGEWVTRIDATASSVGLVVTGNIFAFFGEADGQTALPLEVSVDGGKPERMDFTHGESGRLVVYREKFVGDWTKGEGKDHIVSIKPIPDAKKPNGEVRIESVMSGTFRPTALALMIAQGEATGMSLPRGEAVSRPLEKDIDLDALDHARGKK